MPSSDQTRLEILRDLEILDTPPDIELDEITKLAALLISAPIALVSLVDETRQWFKSKFGISVNETPRDISFCTHAIANGDLFEIPNALEDSRFRENPLVTSEPFVRFYAGVPLRLEKGAIGTLCVIDHVPRRLTVEQREGLILLAKQVTHHLIWRKVFRTYLRLKDSVESQTSGWLLEDHRDQPIFLNGGLLSLFGLTMDRGKFRHSDLAPFFQDPAGFADRTKDCREKLHSVKNQEFQLADGRWIEREYVPRLSGESVDAHIWTYRDITERKKNSILLEYQKAQMVEGQRLSSLGEMAAGLAHEINNPLTVIYGRAAHLKELSAEQKLDQARTARYAQEILDVTTRVMKIIKGLRSFAREGDGDPMDSVNVADIVGDTMVFCQQRLKGSGVEVRAPALESRISICARATQISQIILNLVNNAFDAVQDLEEKWIEVDAFTVSGEAVISVTDSGKGIPLEIREKIFDPFFTTKKTHQGTGLGLSISKRIAEDHGGRLELDVNSARTRFLIRLPLTET